MNILENLNNKQLEAAETINGPLLILAGAGSGKTRTITSRIANILEKGYAWPSQILAITFTNKAAREMRERIAQYDIPETNNMWVSTFHAACARILRMYAHLLGYTNHFKILDSIDQTSLIKKVLKDLNIDSKRYSPNFILNKISELKNSEITPEQAQNMALDLDWRILEAYKYYEERLKSQDSMDFDDLILKTNKIMRQNPEVLDYLQRKFKFVFVDEFQDTNKSQYEFVSMIARGNGNLCVCGDDDQSIARPYRLDIFFA